MSLHLDRYYLNVRRGVTRFLKTSILSRSRFDSRIGEADSARDSGDWGRAAKHYSAALSLRPRAGWVHVQLGHALKELGDHAAAIEAYNQAVSITPEDADALLHLGHLLKNTGQIEKALSAFERRQCILDDKNVRNEIEIIIKALRTKLSEFNPHFEYHYSIVNENIDIDYYRSNIGPERRPYDAVIHYLTIGWLENRDPARWFSTKFYLESNADVVNAGVNPFVHYLAQGRGEGRLPCSDSGVMPVGPASQNVYDQHSYFTSPGPEYEDLDPSISHGRNPKAKVIAYYLPQFHSIPENDLWWGKGFTEWRNVSRGISRFIGHYQPRVPRDLGFYDLSNNDVLKEQSRLASEAGIYGFCFYYYYFNGRRILSRPTEDMLERKDIDFPFCIMWANENWTRTWDGLDSEVLLSQDYKKEDEEALTDDLARHFKDPRYIRINGRPLYFIYRPGLIPNARETLGRWRALFASRHGLNPLFYMAQGFGDTDPNAFGLDGAIEFPPHKLAADLVPMNQQLDVLDPTFSGQVCSYDDVIQRSLSDVHSPFPLIKTATPGWDNEARRPGRGMLLHGTTPPKFERWMRHLVRHAAMHPVQGNESFVAVNAWNEWAEGAYLEPDVHYGGAYLNALSRAVFDVKAPQSFSKRRVLIVGHDAYPHGAQMLVRNLGRTMSEQFGCAVSFIICGEGPLLSDYKQIGECITVKQRNQAELEARISDLWDQGIRDVIVNTTVSGWTVPALKKMGFNVTCLIHELATLIGEYGLESEAKAIAEHASVVVFPAIEVRNSFVEISGPVTGETIIQPQGLYRTELLDADYCSSECRKTLGIPDAAKVVMNVGYADARKGFDLFLRTANSLCSKRDDVYFIWVGGGTPDVRDWQMADIKAGPFGDRIILTGYVENVEEYYLSADLLFLTSREDPFPSVVLEAFAVGLPVLAFENSGGCVSLVSQYGHLVDRNDPSGIDRAVLEMLDTADEEAAGKRREIVRRDFLFDSYAHRLLQLTDQALASVSVAVPSYNYERYMADRLNSIFSQSYPILETLVLDDASTDGSREAAVVSSSRAQRTIVLNTNAKNSGSVFRQWRAAALSSRADYLWIAEADDIAHPRFIEALVGKMEQSGAAFGFTDSWQIGLEDERLGESYRPYVNSVKPGAFDQSFVMDGHEFLREFLSVKNVVLNVSGVLWRRSALIEAMDAIGEELFDYKVAGDWRLYAQACLTGSVAYEVTALNGHRRHAKSVTRALAAKRHLDEVGLVQAFVAQQVQLDESLLVKQALHLADVRRVLNLDSPQTPPKRKSAAKQLKPAQPRKR